MFVAPIAEALEALGDVPLGRTPAIKSVSLWAFPTSSVIRGVYPPKIHDPSVRSCAILR